MAEQTTDQTTNQVNPADARTFLADFGHGPDALKSMPDPDVMKLHGAVTTSLTKHAPKPNGDWRASLKDEDAKKFAESSPDVEHLTKRALDMRTKLSTAIVKPGKDAKPEELAAYHKTIGVPETPEGYKFEMPEGREPTEADKAFQAAWAKGFHDDKVPAEYVSKINQRWNAFVLATEKAQLAEDTRYAQETEAALKQKWGGDEQFSINRQHGDRAARELFGAEYDNVRQITGKDGRYILDHPAFVEMFAKVGREMSEDKTFGRIMTDTDKQAAESRVKDIHSKIDEAMSRNDFDTANKLDQELQGLHRKIGGSKPVVGSLGRVA